MASTSNIPRLVFPEGFTDRDEWEMERKGFVYAFLECEDGRRYPVMFIDPVRLSQDIEATLQSGQSYYYEGSQVIVPEVTRTAIDNIIADLVDEGFLDRHVPQNEFTRDQANVNGDHRNTGDEGTGKNPQPLK